MASAVRDLREALELRFPDAMPIARGLAPAVGTGVPVLDGALPNRGLPRGCLTVWRGGAGATALLRSACVEAVVRGERAVWVDGAGAVLGDFWPAGVMVVRPGGGGGGGSDPGSRGRGRGSGRGHFALAAAEELLRCGGFALVVVTGVPEGVDAELVRLSRVAREGGGALVAVDDGRARGRRQGQGGVAARLKVETWYRPEGHVWRRGPFGEPVEVETMGMGARVMGTGWLRSVDFQLPVREHAYRLSLDSGLVDRRGVRTAGVRQQASGVSGGDGVESVVGSGLAGAGEAGGVAAGGGAEAADRGAGSDLGGRAWPGRASLRRRAASLPRRRRVG
ncbi:MAG TPA: hypothetical protein VMN78_12855 [Longimicrobiales bacterium]|nr:hypothetical protein [Longimicrobiales bacterium]